MRRLNECRKPVVCLMAVVALLSVPAVGEIEKTVEAFVPVPTKVMTYQHWGNKTGNFQGKLDFLEEYRANIIDAKTGKNLRIPLFYFSPPDMNYFMSQLALRNFPKELTRWNFSADEKSKNRLIDIETDNLPLGPLKQVKNSGSLGGSFVNANFPPSVKEVDGRKGIFFKVNHQQYIKPQFEMLTSDFTLENRLDQKQPFTVSAWIYTQASNRVEGGKTIVSWHSLGGDHGTSLNIGRTCTIGGIGKTSRGTKGSKEGWTGINAADHWQHVTYTYTGGENGIFRVYRDGNMTYEMQRDNIVELEPAVNITGTSATLRAKLLSDKGKATVSFYIGEHDMKEWFQMRHRTWEQNGVIEWAQAGEVQWTFDNLKPNTKYFYRIMSIDHDANHWSYDLNPSRRWTYGPGTFVTGSADGKTPGKNLTEDKQKHFFIGGDWSSAWYMGAQGPNVDKFFDGGIADLRVYDYAMDLMNVRLNAGLTKAGKPTPADGARLMEMFALPSWAPAHPKTVQYDVTMSLDKDAVDGRTAKAVRTSETKLPRKEIDHGRTYYWAVDQLDAEGNLVAKGDTWSFTSENGLARNPDPAVGEKINIVYDLRWTPGPKGCSYQNFYLAESEEDLARMTEPTQKIESSRWGPEGKRPLTGEEVIPGRTYFWRVDSVYETREPGTEPIDKNRPDRGMKPGKLLDTYVAKGDVWRFETKPYFTPESDIASQQPNADEQSQARMGAKMLELEVGHPGVTTPAADQKKLFQKVVGTSSMIGKSKMLMDHFDAVHAASVLGSHEADGGKFFGGWTGYSYGNAEAASILLVHETGHQVFGHLSHCIPGYAKRIEDIWLGTSDTNVGLGGYNANNVHENMAVFMQMFGYADWRERMYKTNYKQAVALGEYLPGEMVVGLDANCNIIANSEGVVTSWGNTGWLRRWDDGQVAYVPKDGTVGSFIPAGKPTIGTVAGVAAVKFDGESGFKWDEKIQWSLSRNLPFSVEYWVYQTAEQAAGGPQLIAAWGEKNDNGTGFYIGADGTIYDHGSKKSGKLDLPKGQWNHIVQVYDGAGPTGSIDKGVGAYRVYVNGKVAHTANLEFAIPEKQSVYVGGRIDADGKVSEGLKGAIASVKIYDYALSDYQATHYYGKQAPNFGREQLAVAGKLYVDLDARLLADTQQGYHRPTYPAKMRKPWLRSWSNKGVLGGRVHNDTHTAMWGYSGSVPVLKEKMGVKMPTFDGMDRMVSGFEPTAEMLAAYPGSIELWLDNQAQHPGEVILQWGDFVLTADGLPTGQQTVTIVFDTLPAELTGPIPTYQGKRKLNAKQMAGWNHDQQRIREQKLAAFVRNSKSKLYVNGKLTDKKVGVLAPKDGQRMHLGGRFDPIRWNWKDYFNGTIAAVRVHKGALSDEQIAANVKAHPFSAGGVGVVAPKRQTPAPIIALDADGLKDGPLKEWKNEGSDKKLAFIPGTRGDIMGLNGDQFKGIAGVNMPPNRELMATFDTPEALRKGPFTLQLHIVDEVSQVSAMKVLTWGDNSVQFTYGTRKREASLIAWKPKKKDQRGRPDKLVELDRCEKDDPYFNPHMAYIWRKVAIVYDGKELKYYVDGEMTNSVPFEGLDVPAGKMTIGSRTNGGQPNHVLLNSIKLIGRALSDAELKKLATDDSFASSEALINVVVPKTVTEGSRVTKLTNTGSLKGDFTTLPEPDSTAKVATVAGLQAVEFDGRQTYMMSNVNTPKTLTGNHAFTMEMFIRPNDLNRESAIFTMAPSIQPTQCHLYFGPPTGVGIFAGRDQKLRFNRKATQVLKPKQWMHVAYVYDGGRRSKIRLYVNGTEAGAFAHVSLATLPGYRMYLGTAFGDGKGAQMGYAGAIHSMKVYDYPWTVQEIEAASAAANEKVKK